ncbi:hypothetical protein LJC64_00010 [Ruminococcaceae bacterium OttesenSCG-928-A11]|nr:hypothetical protein [Ruminococcaceae bacterium OttesenSCG-928-A11]
MAISLDSYLNNYRAASSVSQMKLMSQMLDAQKTAQSFADTHKKNTATVNTMKKESAAFLSQYTTGMSQLSAAANKLAGGGISKMLNNWEGNVTESAVKNTVGAVKDMVASYNSNLKLLNDNADRGPGVMTQMARMVTDPAPQEEMAQVGISVNEDGTLALDEEKLTAALKTEDADQRRRYEDIIGGYGGVADNIRQDARAGLDTPVQKLVSSDVTKMQTIREEDPIRSYFKSIRSGGAYALNNNAAMGIMMNMLA